MKDIWLFIKWQYEKFDFTEKVFIVDFFLLGFTAAREDEISKVLFYCSILVPFLYMTKWFIIDRTIESYRKFKKEKAELFNTIKEAEIKCK